MLVLCRKDSSVARKLLSHERSGPIHKCESITCFEASFIFFLCFPLREERGAHLAAVGEITPGRTQLQSLTGALSGRQRYRGSYHKPERRQGLDDWGGGGQLSIEHAAQCTVWRFFAPSFPSPPRAAETALPCRPRHRLPRVAGAGQGCSLVKR